MKTLKYIGFTALAIVLVAGAIGFAETSRLGAARAVTFNPTKVVQKTAAYTVLLTDSQIDVTASSANIVITLPSIADATTKGTMRYKIVKKDSTVYHIIVTPATGDTVGGEATRRLIGDEAYMVISSGPGRNWTVDYESPYLFENHALGTWASGTIGSGGAYSATTASATLTASNCGMVISAATGTSIFTLPATIANCQMTFVNLTTTGLKMSIQPNASDYIYGTIYSPNQFVSAVTYTGIDNITLTNSGTTAAKGDLVTLYGDGSTGWLITKNSGTWVMP